MTTNSVMGRVRLPLAAHSLCLCEFCVESITVAGRGSRYSLSLMLLLSTNSDSTSRNRAHDRSGMVTAVRKLLRTCHRKKSTHCTMLCNTQSKILQGCTPVLHFKHLLLQFLKFVIWYFVQLAAPIRTFSHGNTGVTLHEESQLHHSKPDKLFQSGGICTIFSVSAMFFSSALFASSKGQETGSLALSITGWVGNKG